MYCYSRMGVLSTDHFTTKSRSMDFADPYTFSPPPKQRQEEEEEADAKPHEHFSRQQQEEEEEEEEEEEGAGERFGVILSRTCSSASQRFIRANINGCRAAETSTCTLHQAVNRAFSMRRSSSVREGYCRIHESTGDYDDGEEDSVEEQQLQQMGCSSNNNKKKKGKFLRACKKLFGF